MYVQLWQSIYWTFHDSTWILYVTVDTETLQSYVYLGSGRQHTSCMFRKFMYHFKGSWLKKPCSIEYNHINRKVLKFLSIPEPWGFITVTTKTRCWNLTARSTDILAFPSCNAEMFRHTSTHQNHFRDGSRRNEIRWNQTAWWLSPTFKYG
jgi:hypothetical protein